MLLIGASPGAVCRSRGGGRLVPVALALLAMLAMSLVHSGMVAALAEGAAGSGAIWPLLAPAIGVLGTLVTGSATASNILFTDSS